MKSTAIIIMLITVIARILGFVREILMSNFYGTSSIADIVVIALSVPTVILAFMASSLNTSFIPSYDSIRMKKGREVADEFTANIANVVAVISFLISILGIIFARYLVFALASGFKGQTFETAVIFVRIVLLGSATNIMASIFTGYLNIHNSYILPASRAVLQNIILIIFTLLSVYTNVYFLAIGILVATVMENALLIPGLMKVGYKHKLKIDIKDENIRYILYLAVPLMVGVAVDQINVFVDKTLASQISTGGIATLNYADRINALVTIVTTSIITVAYPAISKFAINKDMKNLKISVFKYIQINLIFCIPTVLAFILFGVPIVEIIYQRGQFTAQDTIRVSQCLALFSITMLGISFRDVVARTFYSLGDTKTPVKNGMFMVLMNAVFSFILSRYIGLPGIAMGTSIASVIGAGTLLILLRKKIGKLNTRVFIKNALKISAISIMVIGPARLAYDRLVAFIGVDKSLFLVAILAVIIYFAIIVIVDISDSRRIFKNAVAKIKANIIKGDMNDR